MKNFILLTLVLIAQVALRAQDSKPEINFWNTTTIPATLRLPALIHANAQQINNNSTSTQPLDITTLRLRLEAIRPGNLLINHALHQLILIGQPEAFDNLTQEQINILVEYYPNVTLLGFEGLPESGHLIAEKISSAFKHVKKFFIMPERIEQLPQELKKLIESILHFNSK